MGSTPTLGTDIIVAFSQIINIILAVSPEYRPSMEQQKAAFLQALQEASIPCVIEDNGDVSLAFGRDNQYEEKLSKLNKLMEQLGKEGKIDRQRIGYFRFDEDGADAFCFSFPSKKYLK